MGRFNLYSSLTPLIQVRPIFFVPARYGTQAQHLLLSARLQRDAIVARGHPQ